MRQTAPAQARRRRGILALLAALACLEKVTSCSHEELQPHMYGWSTHGPYWH
jgi:hypothetical protein